MSTPHENTPLLSTSPPTTPTNTPGNQSISSSSSSSSSGGSKVYSWILIFYFLIHVATIALGYYYYQITQTKFAINDQKIENITRDYENLRIEYQLKLQQYEQHEDQTMTKIETIEQDLDERISYLENIPSNDQVMQELHTTEQALYDEIESEKTLMSVMVKGIQANVTNSINRSNRLVDKKLNDVDSKLKSSERRMSNLVEETSRNVSTSVQLAENHIQVIETNLTSQMTQMSTSVSYALNSVRNMVEDAKTDINEEVRAVHESMDQYIIFSNNQFAAENDFVKYQLAGTFSLLACLICLWHITSHGRHISSVEVQKRIMAILWMVPIYSVTSWLSLVFPLAQPYLGVLRDCYEAYVVYTFIAFLKSALGEDEDGRPQNVIEVLARQFKKPPPATPIEQIPAPSIEQSDQEESLLIDPKDRPDDNFSNQTIERSSSKDVEKGKNTIPPTHPVQKAPCPCCIPAREKKSPTGVAAATLHQCEIMAMQFVFIKPLLATAPFFIALSGYDYEGRPPISDGNVDWFSARLYILICGNLSVSIAFYGLLCFFHLTEKELAWCKPWPKFLCVKGVVFMTFWQDILLQCMSGSGMVDTRSAGQIQNLLICIEMFMASIAHFYIFPYEEWDPKKRKQASVEVRDTMAFYAFLNDFKRLARGNPQKHVDDASQNDTPHSIRSYTSGSIHSPAHAPLATPNPSHSVRDPTSSSSRSRYEQMLSSDHPSPSSPYQASYNATPIQSESKQSPNSRSSRPPSHLPTSSSSPTKLNNNRGGWIPNSTPSSSHHNHSPSVILHGSDSESDSDLNNNMQSV